jgi:hypothetical protein
VKQAFLQLREHLELVIETTADGHVAGFHEKNPEAPTMPGDSERVYASMGNYVFSTDLLLKELYADAANQNSSHDFGRDILPSLVGRTEMFAYDFQTNRIPRGSSHAGALLARCGNDGCLLRCEHGPARGFAQL